MLLQIAEVVDEAMIGASCEAAADEACWRDGRATATGRAREAKSNQQALIDGPAKGVLETLSRLILANPVVRSAALPDRLARIMLNRYRVGMSYGDHVDAAYVDSVRTDLSFTLFLSAPENYDGGDLVIESAGAQDRIKLPAGSLVLYPSASVHRVETVTRGERLACVGWIKSRVRSADARATLFELDAIAADLAAANAPGPVRDRLANVHNNLMRQWGD